MGTEEKELKKRETWVGNCEYILSLFGYLSGSGDFWKYPYLFWKNGGGTFMMVYLFALVVCSIPVYFLEVTISQYSGKGMYDVWCICPLFSGICVTMFIINIYLLVMVPTLRVWIMSYIRYSFFSVLPWTTCGNSWNTDACVEVHSGYDGSANNSTVYWNKTVPINATNEFVTSFSNYTPKNHMSSEEEFWRYELLDESSGLEEFGGLQWDLVLYNFMLRGLVVICVIKSVKSIGKVMYVTTIVPIVLLIIIFIRTLLLPGAIEGLVFFITPDFSKLANKQMWMEAGFGALNTVGIGMGGTLVVGSRGKFRSSVLRSTLCACTLDVFGSIFTSMLFFSVLGVMAAEENRPMESAVSSGTSVAFVSLTKAFSFLPGSRTWTIIFFAAAFIALLDVVVIVKEVVVNFIMNWIPYFRDRHTMVVFIVFILSSILSLPYLTQGGPFLYLISSWYYGSWCTLITTLIETIICMWIFGGEGIDETLKYMVGRPMPVVFRLLAAFVCPIICILFFAISLATFRPPTYGDYHYSAGAEAFGYCLGVLPVLPIPIVMAIKIYRMKGPIKKRFTTLLKPSSEWEAVEKDNEKPHVPLKYGKKSFIDTAYYNAIGRRRTKEKQNGHVSADDIASVPLHTV